MQAVKTRSSVLVTTIVMLGASACTFRVDNTADLPDANPGDGECAIASELGSKRDAAGSLQLAQRTQSGSRLPDPVLKAPTGRCTLRAAVMEANARLGIETIEIPAGHYVLDLPISEGGGALKLSGSVRLQGAGAAATRIDAAGGSRVVHADFGKIRIHHVTVEGGNSQSGAGLYVEDAEVELSNVVLRNNESFSGGGGLSVDSGGEVIVRNTEIRENIGAQAGGVWNYGVLWIYDSTIAGNLSTRAGGIHNGSSGQLNLRGVTISGNEIVFSGDGTGGLHQQGFAVLNNVTITDNLGNGNSDYSFRGGGLMTGEGDITVMKSSIVAGNSGGNGPADCVGSLSAESRNNLIGDTTECVISSHVGTYLLDVDAGLGNLANNGGPTRTHHLVWNSPALGAGYAFPPPAIHACEAVDQRGVPRPQGGDACDMGAYELTDLSARIVDFVLVDADADEDLRSILDGDVLVLSELPPNLSIRAVHTGTPGSVVFDFDGVTDFQTENNSPWALDGDNAGDYFAVPLAGGDHSVSATPFQYDDGGGEAGISLSVDFEVR